MASGFVGAGGTGVSFRNTTPMGPAVATGSIGSVGSPGSAVVGTAVGDGVLASSIGGSEGSGGSVHLELELGNGGSERSDLAVID